MQMQGMMQQIQGMTEQMAEMMKDGAMSPEQQRAAPRYGSISTA
jgi:hypothetical protein